MGQLFLEIDDVAACAERLEVSSDGG